MVIDLNGNGTLTANDFILSGGVTSDNATHNVLLGNTGANTFHGGGGFDYLYGDAGNDKLYGEGDSDMVRGGDRGRSRRRRCWGRRLSTAGRAGTRSCAPAATTSSRISSPDATGSRSPAALQPASRNCRSLSMPTAPWSRSAARRRCVPRAPRAAPADGTESQHDSIFLTGVDAHHISAADFIFG